MRPTLFLGWLGASTLALGRGVGGFAAMGCRALGSAWQERRRGRAVVFHILVKQAYFTGVQALPIITLTAVALGTLVATQAQTFLARFGSGGMVKEVISWILVRELVPIFTALVVIGRSGTALTTELGDMMLNREVEALRAMGVNPDYYIVFPRLVGVAVATACLAIFSIAAGVAGGYVLTEALGTAPFTFHLSDLFGALALRDVAGCLLKSSLFGVIIAILHCRHGLAVRKSSTEIPQRTTRAVVQSIFLCLLVNGFVSLYVFPA